MLTVRGRIVGRLRSFLVAVSGFGRLRRLMRCLRSGCTLGGSLALLANVMLVMFRGLRLCLLCLLMVPMLICRFILMLLDTGWAMAIVPCLGLLATGTICSILFLRWIVLVLSIRSFIILMAILTGFVSGRVLLRRGFANLACWV